MVTMFRGLFIAITIFVIWEVCCIFFELPTFMLPPPTMIFVSIYNNWEELLVHSSYTLVEILASIVIGTIIGKLCYFGMRQQGIGLRSIL